jgi:hypothetical protein
LLIGPGYRVPNETWTMARDEIFFVDRAPNLRSATIRAYHLRMSQIRPILALTNLLPERAATELALSSDSRWLLFSRLDRSGSSVMVANIR